jgi:hypothetical protein
VQIIGHCGSTNGLETYKYQGIGSAPKVGAP